MIQTAAMSMRCDAMRWVVVVVVSCGVCRVAVVSVWWCTYLPTVGVGGCCWFVRGGASLVRCVMVVVAVVVFASFGVDRIHCG